ncbi:FxSxx-COOH system tetratricopeptide repeat protein [Streptomyces pseudovenezuelae]|uniref:FxSxx-COOH system tetratricopeptide repeat protein n=1 Tax=Streptomyces pseudovenezuelae TaxID=67350 RepID=UPI0036E038E2
MTADTQARREGKIVTFYSYKGGTGRTMALVNVGWILASRGLRVLLVDWDLEAPGMHRYLRPLLVVDSELRSTDGLINMVQAYVGRVMGSGRPDRATAEPGAEPAVMGEEELRACADPGPYTTGLRLSLPPGGRLDFLPAGRQSAAYSAAVTSFNWHSFYERLGGGAFLQTLRRRMAEEYDYVLIDSRTGVSDISGICTILLPDIVVDGFVLNHQSIEGGIAAAGSVAASASRPIRILPVPMRVENAEQELLDQGRDSARAGFAPFLSWLGEEHHGRYWGEVEIPYKPYYAYAEIPATVRDRLLQKDSLLTAFERLTAWITDHDVQTLEPQPAEERKQLATEYLRDPRAVPPRMYVSYAPIDRMWAEWAAAHLETVGYEVSLHSAVEPMTGAPPEATAVLERHGRLLALLSPEYLTLPRARIIAKQLGDVQAGGGPALLPVRVQETEAAPGRPFGDRTALDLTRRQPDEAAMQLLLTVGAPSGRRSSEPGTPPLGTVVPPYPSDAPAVQRVPSRNVSFTGRGALLDHVRDGFTAGPAPRPQVLYGLGGMGKTQVAQEYAHRFKSAYDAVWWVNAAQPGLIRSGLAELAPDLGLERGEDVSGTADAVLRALRRGEPYDRWLLVYDNAGRPEALADLIPEGPPGGHVLMTSRDRAWVNNAGLVEVEVFQRRESVELLRRLNPGLAKDDAERVAEELGDLPLAVGQAAVWLSESSMPVATYLSSLGERLTEVLRSTRLPDRDYPHSAVATWLLALDELRRVNLAAAEMLEICSFFGPDPIPQALLYGRAVTQALTLPEGEPRDEMAIAQVVRAINRFGLARSEQGSETLTVHRLVQAVIRDQVPDERRADLRRVVHTALADARPGDPDRTSDWKVYDQLLPHLAPSRAYKSADPQVRAWITDSVRYLWKRSLHAAAHELASHTLERWQDLGISREGDAQTLILRIQLGNVLRSLGRLREAYESDRDTHERLRRSRGDEDAHTLAAAGNVAADLRELGRYLEARELDRRTLRAARRTLGDDHKRTLMYLNNLALSEYLAGDRRAALELHHSAWRQQSETHGANSINALSSASNYARDLRETGRLREALELLESTVARYRETLGEDHVETLRARKNLAVALRRNGEYERAREIDEDIRSRYVADLGPDHQDTLAAASNLASDLAALGEPAGALELAERVMNRYHDYLGAMHPVTLACVNNVSVYLRLVGDTTEAHALVDRALEGLRSVLGETHLYTLACIINHANELVTEGDLDGAAAQEEFVREQLERTLGPEHYDTIGVTSNLSLTLRAAGRTAEADRLAEEARRNAVRALGENHPTTKAVRSGQRLDSDIEPPTT